MDEILLTALEQSALEVGCTVDDFLSSENKIFPPYKENEKMRKYYKLPVFCNLISYGNNIVASADDRIKEFIKSYIDKHTFVHAFETPAVIELNEHCLHHNARVMYMAEYFLPDKNKVSERDCDFKIRTLSPKDFSNLYTDEWGNALCADRKELDKIAVAAYDGDKIIALAGASADCEKMWQIGIDVLPDYRKKGIACALTSKIALEIFDAGKVPFYCAAWSNIPSVRNAIKSGFSPAWCEMTLKEK